MHIGVTGAKGFIGMHLLSALKKQGTVVTLPHQKGLPGKQEFKRFVADPIFFFTLEG
jgi:nucleoside-diphosphate-sugar epimerase